MRIVDHRNIKPPLFGLQYGSCCHPWEIQEKQSSIYSFNPRRQTCPWGIEPTTLCVWHPSRQSIRICKTICQDTPDRYTGFELGEEGLHNFEVPWTNHCDFHEEIHCNCDTGTVLPGGIMFIPKLCMITDRGSQKHFPFYQQIFMLLVCWFTIWWYWLWFSLQYL